MTNKTILVHYVCIKGMSQEIAHIALKEYAALLENDTRDKEILHYVMPISGESRIECINPTPISEEEYNATKLSLDHINLKIIP